MKYIFLFSLLPYSQCFAKSSHLKILSIGESLKIPSSVEQNLRVQKKGILRIKDNGSSLILIGKKIGTTTVHIGKQSFKVIVAKKNIYTSWEQLSFWAKKKRGPLIKIDENSTSVEGRILTFNDFLDLPTYTNEKSDFKIIAQFSKPTESKIVSFFNNTLSMHNLFSGEILFSPHLRILIPSHQKKSLSRYKKILNPYGTQVEIDQASLSQKPVIKMKLQIAHIKKSFFRNFGIQWPSEFSASIVPGSKVLANNFNLSLQNIESKGLGKILATPTLIAESGEKAHFHSGGEFPIRSSSQFSNNIHWKPYGLFLNLKPIANAQKALQIHIESEISSIDKSVSSDGVPGMTRSKVKTTVNMKHPRPIVLSGLIQKDFSNSREGLSWLSQIPLLKPLFSRKEIYDTQYELVFILTPEFL